MINESSIIISELKYPKIAAFDLDHTLIKPKSGKKFPVNKDDWIWMYANVPEKLSEYYNNGYTIVVFTNQKKIKSLHDFRQKLHSIQDEINPPINFFISTETDHYRKPKTGMWDYFSKQILVDIDYENSFYCGDAAGRQKDFSDSDRLFAHNIKIKFELPENIFMHHKFILPPIKLHPLINYKSNHKDDISIINTIQKYTKNKIAIINIGIQASGKSFFSNNIISAVPTLKKISSDTIKNKNKFMKEFHNLVKNSNNIIIDNTNPDISTRKLYVDILKENDYKIIFVWFNLPLEVSLYLNEYRTQIGFQHIPRVAYNVYKSKFNIPTKDEGIDEIIEIKNVYGLYDNSFMFQYLF